MLVVAGALVVEVIVVLVAVRADVEVAEGTEVGEAVVELGVARFMRRIVIAWLPMSSRAEERAVCKDRRMEDMRNAANVAVLLVRR